PSPASPICSTTRSASASGWRPSPTSSPTRRARSRRSRRCRADGLDLTPSLALAPFGRVPGQWSLPVTAQNVFFYVIAIAMVVSALRMVTVKNVVHAAMYLVVVLAGVAAQFILLASEFI